MANPISKLNLVINGVTTQLDIHDANAVDLSSNQTVAGNKNFTGTTTAHDVIPSATDTYNFGSPTAQWNNAYIKSLTINGVSCGDILTHNASEFVPVSGGNLMTGSLGPSTSGGASLGDSTHKWAALNDVDINNIGFPSASGIDVTGSLTDYTSGQDVVGKYYITTVPGFASGRFYNSTGLRFKLLVYESYNDLMINGDPIFALPLIESFGWGTIPAAIGSYILIKPERYISPADMENAGWALRIYPNKGL